MFSARRFAMSEAIRKAYKEGQEDETLKPFVLSDSRGNRLGRLKNDDAVIFYNIRGEREIELTQSLTDATFEKFPTLRNMKLHFATMIEYQKGLNVRVAFPPNGFIEDTLSEIIAKHGLKQVKITEAEKAVHVGFFLNGKKLDPWPNEERAVIPTRKDIALFDEAPKMSIKQITKATIEKIHDASYQFIFVNFPNVDVVGHIENEQAIIKAVETVDASAGIVVREALKQGITTIVSADHGTVEKWRYSDGTIDTGHTDSPVPFILIYKNANLTLRQGGDLTDVAPTVLDLMGIPKSPYMTGQSLIKINLKDNLQSSERLLFILLDGWGINSAVHGNLIKKAHTPTMDWLMQTYPYTALNAAGEAVGLPAGMVGNSEAGHLHIGAGRKIYADRVKIDQAIADRSFFHNEALVRVIEAAKKKTSALHLLGIVSFFSSHGSINHLFALMDLAKKQGVVDLFIHAMLGRRGETPESGANYIRKIEEKIEQIQLGKIVSVIGRYWSMDREGNWDRIEKTYRMLVHGEGNLV
jgi:2,3-bisphosphoglycerate-independent phosphoglycerate mutase